MQMLIPPRQGGFSLIELTVATAIYSMGLGSLSLMLMLAVQGTTEARFETTATIRTASLAEMILMNSDAAGHYALEPVASVARCGLEHACTNEEMATWQLSNWRGRLAADLPGGWGLVCRDQTLNDGDAEDPACDGDGADVIKVFWHAPAGNSASDAPPTRQVLRLP